MDGKAATSFAKQLAAVYPMQHIGDTTIEEMAKEFLPLDEELGPKVVDALKGRSAWFPTPFEVRNIMKGFRGSADLDGIRTFEEDLIANVARVRGIPYPEALALRRGVAEDYLQEALDCNLESGPYWALKLRVLRDMERRMV